MTAKEMFEELGYKEDKTLGFMIEYYTPIRTNDRFEKISFILDEKVFYKSTELGRASYITKSELRAINQQCKELGWEVVDENN